MSSTRSSSSARIREEADSDGVRKQLLGRVIGDCVLLFPSADDNGRILADCAVTAL